MNNPRAHAEFLDTYVNINDRITGRISRLLELKEIERETIYKGEENKIVIENLKHIQLEENSGDHVPFNTPPESLENDGYSINNIRITKKPAAIIISRSHVSRIYFVLRRQLSYSLKNSASIFVGNVNNGKTCEMELHTTGAKRNRITNEKI